MDSINCEIKSHYDELDNTFFSTSPLTSTIYIQTKHHDDLKKHGI